MTNAFVEDIQKQVFLEPPNESTTTLSLSFKYFIPEKRNVFFLSEEKKILINSDNVLSDFVDQSIRCVLKIKKKCDARTNIGKFY